MYTRAREPSLSVITGSRSRKWFSTCSPSVADCSEVPSRISRGRKDAAVVADLRESAQSAYGGSGGECLQIAVIDFRGKPCRSDLVESDVLCKLDGKAIGADGPVKGDEHLSLLGVSDALHTAQEPRSLRQQELLVIVRVKVGRQIDHDRPAESAVDVIGDHTLKNGSLEDTVKTALVGVEVVGGQCGVLAIRLCLNTGGLGGGRVTGHRSSGRAM